MDAGVPRSSRDRGYLAGLVGVLSLEAVGATYQIVTGVPVPVITLVATAFAIACMLRVHGLWGTLAFLVIVLAIPFGSEFLGVLTGFPYGPYAYTGMPGPWLFGLVPVFIFVAWVNIAYLAIATTTLAHGRSSLWLAPLDGVLAAAWDVMVDPLAVRAGYWAWRSPQGLYGIPYSNFAGWFLVVTLLSLVARTVWTRDVRAPAHTPRTVAWILPTLLFGSSVAFGALAVASGFVYAAVIGVVLIGTSAAAAWARLARLPRDVRARSPWATSTRRAKPERAAPRT